MTQVNREEIQAHRKRIRDILKSGNDHRIKEVMEHINLTKTEIALRMIIDDVPDEKIKSYTGLSMISIEELHLLAIEILETEAKIKSELMLKSVQPGQHYPLTPCSYISEE